MPPATVVNARQYQDANNRIIFIFSCLEETVNTLDKKHLKGKTLLNAPQLFPIADNFVRNVSDATRAIHESYINYILQGGQSPKDHSDVISREGARIFQEVKNVILQAPKLKTLPTPSRFSSIKNPNHHIPDIEQCQANAATYQLGNKADYNQSKKIRGPIEESLFQLAQRIGPEYGSNFLLGVEDVFLAVVDMLHSIKDAGINIDINQLLSAAPLPEARTSSRSVTFDNTHIGGGVDILLRLMHQRRIAAINAWAVAR